MSGLSQDRNLELWTRADPPRSSGLYTAMVWDVDRCEVAAWFEAEYQAREYLKAARKASKSREAAS